MLINRIEKRNSNPNSKASNAKNFIYLFSIVIFRFMNLRTGKERKIARMNEIAYVIIAPPGLCAKTIKGKTTNEKVSIIFLFIVIQINTYWQKLFA